MSRLLAALLFLVVAACSDQEKTGPEDVVWDRDICTLCIMSIADASFTAQVRGGERRNIHKFDDIGCAIIWLNQQTWVGDAKTEIWVADAGQSTRQKVIWLNARDAFYRPGRMSPMAYGFAATATADDDTLDFTEVTNMVLRNGPNHICPAE